MPLTFAPPPDACSLTGSSASNVIDVYGSELMTQATGQWDPSFCQGGSDVFSVVHVVSGEPEARNLVATGSAEAAFTSYAQPGGYGKPVVNAPVAISGFTISYDIDGANGQPYTSLKLTPLLLAKLLTESYPGELFMQQEDPALAHNPLNITQDPEFSALNPGISPIVISGAASEAASELMALSSDSDVMEALTTYINDDPTARAWLNGTPDQWGMVVNPAYKGIQLPVDQWPLLSTFEPAAYYQTDDNDCLYNDPVPYQPLVAAPLASLADISESLQYNEPNSTTQCSQPTPDSSLGEKLTTDRQQPAGSRFMIGITPLGDDQRYLLQPASLQTTGGTFVAPGNASLQAATSLLTPDTSSGTWPIPYGAFQQSAGAVGLPRHHGRVRRDPHEGAAGVRCTGVRLVPAVRGDHRADPRLGGEPAPTGLPPDDASRRARRHGRRDGSGGAGRGGAERAGARAHGRQQPVRRVGSGVGLRLRLRLQHASRGRVRRRFRTVIRPRRVWLRAAAVLELVARVDGQAGPERGHRASRTGRDGLEPPPAGPAAVDFRVPRDPPVRARRARCAQRSPDVPPGTPPRPMVIDVVSVPPEELERAEEEFTGRTPRTGPPAPRLASVLLSLVMVVSVAALFFGAFLYGLSGLQEQRSQHQLYSAMRGLLSPSSPVAPWIGGTIPAGAPVALLTSPQAGLHDAVIVEGTSSGDLLAGPGHLADTPLPGQSGAAVVLGKSTTAGAPFGELARLRPGDVITVRTGQGGFRYVVRGRLVSGGRLPSVPSTSGFLLLGTSGGTVAPGGFTPSHVVYTYARLQGHAAPTPHGRPHTVPRQDVPGQGDPAAWPFVALWFGLLLAGSAACWWLWSYWGLLRTWLVGAPVLFAVLWELSNEAIRLLPNVY